MRTDTPALAPDVPAPAAETSSGAAASSGVNGAVPAPDSSAPAGVAAVPPGAAPAVEQSRPASPNASAPAARPSDAGAVSAPARAASASPAPAPAGELVVRSDPPGALVTIDGRILGETPLVARGLSLGAHAVQVARPGHVPRAEHVVFRPSVLSQTLDLRLVPGLDQTSGPSEAAPLAATTGVAASPVTPTASGPGAIDIDSRPRGAQVRVDGRLLGAAPMRALDLAAGEHVVTLELPGYATWTGRVMVVPGRPTPIHASLAAASQ
jgi:hypothetical protein